MSDIPAKTAEHEAEKGNERQPLMHDDKPVPHELLAAALNQAQRQCRDTKR